MTDTIEDRKQRQRDFDDLQNEIAGRETGRVQRFLNDGPSSETARRKKHEAEAFQNRLMHLLSDPIYRAKYEATDQFLRNIERATEEALHRLTQMINDAQTALEDTLQNAAKLPDESSVFRDKNGIVRREDGSVVDDDLAATILWRGDEPSYEEFSAQREALGRLREQGGDLVRYQTDVIGDARDKLEDPDNPPSMEELDDILGDIKQQMPSAVKEVVEQQTNDISVDTKISEVLIPDLGSKL